MLFQMTIVPIEHPLQNIHLMLRLLGQMTIAGIGQSSGLQIWFTLRSLAGRNLIQGFLCRPLVAQALIFNQSPAHIQKSNRFVFERRAA